MVSVTPDRRLRGRLVEIGPHKSARRPESLKKSLQVDIMTGIQEALPSRLDDLTRVGDENSSGPIANKAPMSGSVCKNLALALVSGGDSRLRIDRGSGLNKYLCPAEPGAGIVCASSCTASPIAQSGFDRAGALFEAFCGAASVRARRLLLQEEALRIEKCLLR